MANRIFQFGPHVVTPHVFHSTRLSFCVVNLKPLLPGHVLVCPVRRVQHMTDMRPEEVSDMFLTVQRVSRTLKRIYKTSSVNIGVSDGELAGQSVPHVHAHIIPRQYKGDYDDDALYEALEGNDQDVNSALSEQASQNVGSNSSSVQRVDVSGPREPRSDDEMRKEADWLRQEMDEDSGSQL